MGLWVVCTEYLDKPTITRRSSLRYNNSIKRGMPCPMPLQTNLEHELRYEFKVSDFSEKSQKNLIRLSKSTGIAERERENSTI